MVPAGSNGAAAAINRAIPCRVVHARAARRGRASLHATGPRVHGSTGSQKSNGTPRRASAHKWIIRPGSPRPCAPIPAHPPVHLKSPPVAPALLAKAPSTSAGAPVDSLHLTLADLDARANLDWLPPLGPHAEHARAICRHTGRPLFGESAAPNHVFPASGNHHTTRDHPHRGRHGPPRTHTTTPQQGMLDACSLRPRVPPGVPRWAGMQRRYSQCKHKVTGKGKEMTKLRGKHWQHGQH